MSDTNLSDLQMQVKTVDADTRPIPKARAIEPHIACKSELKWLAYVGSAYVLLNALMIMKALHH